MADTKTAEPRAANMTVAGTITDAAGVKYNFSTTATPDTAPPVQDTVTATASVAPEPAAAGTSRTLSVAATSSSGSPLTYATPTAPGITFAPVANQPGKFSFTY